MAQGGHGWPNSGQYNPNNSNPNGPVSSHNGGMGYADDFAPESNLMYMQNWQPVEYPPSTYGNQGQTNHQPANQPAYDSHAYYQGSNTFNDAAQHSDPQPSINPLPQSQLSYGNSRFHDQSYSQSGQQQAYQPFSAPQPAQHSVQAPASYPDNSWQDSQPPQHSQYGQQGIYTAQPGLYQPYVNNHTEQQQYRPDVNTGHLRESQEHLAPRPNEPAPAPAPAPAPSQYQYQVNQYDHSPYRGQSIAQSQSPVSFQGQMRYPAQHESLETAPIQQNAPIHPATTPVQQQALSQPPPVQARRAVAGSQKAPPKSNIAPNLGNVPSPAPSLADGVVPINQQIPLPRVAPPAAMPSPAPSIPPQPAFDPVSAGYVQVLGCPNLFVSETAEAPHNPLQTRNNPDRAFPFVVEWNAKDSSILPGRPHRLPCEIQRDFDYLSREEAAASHDAQKQVIWTEKARLDQEMVNLTGKHLTQSSKERKKATTTRKIKPPTSSRAPVDSSSDEYESESEDEESEIVLEGRKIMMAQRPSDPLKAVESDIVKIIWRDPRVDSPSNWIATAIQRFGQYIEKIWNEVKDTKKKIKDEEKKGRNVDALHEIVHSKMALLRAAVDTANTYADPVVLENLGGNIKLIAQLWNGLRQTISKGSKDPFPKAVLRLMAHCTTLKKDFLETVLKFSDVQKKHAQDFDDECKSYLRKIWADARDLAKPEKKDGDPAKKDKDKDSVPATSNGAKEVPALIKKGPSFLAKDLMSASKKPTPPDAKKPQSAASAGLDSRKVSNGSTKTAASGSPSKRPRDDEADSRASKKLAVDGASSGTQATVKTTGTSGPKLTTITQPRLKSGASILPGRNRPAPKPAPKKSEPQSSSLSTISGLLAEIAKPKSPPRKREEPTRAPETAEERERRLRKESRRGLRVVWKPDHELEEVRIFQHDAAEDEGRASNMIRDARDNRSEGQMLKMGLLDKEDEEEDEEMREDGKPIEKSLRQWNEPTTANLSGISLEQREKSYTTRAGVRSFHTDEQAFMDEYEKRNLMAVYASSADIPETPKSPTRKAPDGLSESTKDIPLASNSTQLQETHLRWAENKQLGTDLAQQRMIERLKNKSSADVASKFDRVLNRLKNPTAPLHLEASQPYAFSNSFPSSNFSTAKPSSSHSQVVSFNTMPPVERDAEVNRLLISDSVRNWADKQSIEPLQPKTQRRLDYGDPKIQADIDAFEDAADSLVGKPYPATAPPEHMQNNPEYIKQWQLGYNNEMAAKADKDRLDRAKKLADDFARSSQQTSDVPQQATSQDPNAAAWTAYFAQLNQPQAPPQQTQAQQLTSEQYTAILQQTQALQAQQATHSAFAQAQQPPSQNSNTQIQALLSALQPQGPGTTAALQTPANSVQDPNAATAAWAAYYALSQAQPATQPQAQQATQSYQAPSQQHQGRDRDRSTRNVPSFGNDGMLDYGGPSEYDSRDKAASRARKEKDSSRAKEFDRKAINRSLIGTKPCSFWAQGKCAKGDQCTFRHDPNDLK
ncbi:hypothetical protein BX600DRAFT_510231 [Xylariales sp. PMI_506]|nr:hypothetical protein BX600DRAFT_510231 [Xylariales sp. PMI_506]